MERKDPLERLRALLVDLDLTALARELPQLLRTAEEGKPAFSEFLRQALDVEASARHARKIQRRVHWSRIGATMALADFDFASRPQLSASVLKELSTCRFVEEKRNVILVGRPSTGKTTIAKILGRAACERAMSVYYVAMTDMLASLHAARADGTYRKALRRVVAPQLLLIDDAGFAALDREATNELFRIVCERYRQRSTVVVTNLPFRRWGEFLSSPEQAVAIADRLIDQATILRFGGPSFRKPRDIPARAALSRRRGRQARRAARRRVALTPASAAAAFRPAAGASLVRACVCSLFPRPTAASPARSLARGRPLAPPPRVRTTSQTVER